MFKMLESQNPGFRVLNLKTRVPKSMRKPGFSGSAPTQVPSLTIMNKRRWAIWHPFVLDFDQSYMYNMGMKMVNVYWDIK